MTAPDADGRRCLLVLDDDPGVVEFLCESLEQAGFAAVGMTSATEALARVKIESFDLVISDVEMPDMRGLDVLRAILAERPNQLVLLITAFGTIELGVAALKEGACDFVTKPFRIEALVHAIERAFQEREMRREIVRLRAGLHFDGAGDIVMRSAAMRTAVAAARRSARSDATILLTGETGTGKSHLARYIHDQSTRREHPFIQLNCAALPASLIDSELFGVRKGAFTDAREDRQGLFVAAADGTLFLDEVGELAVEVQSKLLHALETKKVRPLGGTADVDVRARIIAATNRPLEDLLRAGEFRPDLYYRLNVIRIEVPPLRERREDIGPLVDLFLARAGAEQMSSVVGLSRAAMRRLLNYNWPGNVRELANVLERALALAEHDTILPEDLDLAGTRDEFTALLAENMAPGAPLEQIERVYIRKVLETKRGNKSAAARVLGISRRTLHRKILS